MYRVVIVVNRVKATLTMPFILTFCYCCFYKQGNSLSATDYRAQFEEDVKTLGYDFTRTDVHVPSFLETYPSTEKMIAYFHSITLQMFLYCFNSIKSKSYTY